MGYLEGKGVRREHLKIEWGPPIRIYHKPAPETFPKLIASFSDEKWSVTESNFAGIGAGTEAEFVTGVM